MNVSASAWPLWLALPLVPLAVFGREGIHAAGARVAAVLEDARDEEPVRLTHAPWRAGDRIEARHRLVRRVEYDVRIDGESIETVEEEAREEVERHIEVLAVEEGRPTRIRLHYEEWSESSAADGGDAEETAEEGPSLEGRTFVLEEQDDSVVVRGEDGQTLDLELEELVRSFETDGGKRISRGNDALAEWLALEPRKPGLRLEVPEEVAREAFGRNEIESIDLHLELRELREVEGERCAVFAARATVRAEDEGSEFGFELEGEIAWTVDGLRNLRSEWKGPVEISSEIDDDDVEMEISGAGTLEVEEERSFSRDD